MAQFLGHQEGYLLVDATGVRGLRVAYEIRLRVRVHKMQPFFCLNPYPQYRIGSTHLAPKSRLVSDKEVVFF